MASVTHHAQYCVSTGGKFRLVSILRSYALLLCTAISWKGETWNGTCICQWHLSVNFSLISHNRCQWSYDVSCPPMTYYHGNWMLRMGWVYSWYSPSIHLVSKAVSKWLLALSLPCTRMREGVKQLVLSVCLSVCQSGEKFLNLNIDRVKRFPKLTVALTL